MIPDCGSLPAALMAFDTAVIYASATSGDGSEHNVTLLVPGSCFNMAILLLAVVESEFTPLYFNPKLLEAEDQKPVGDKSSIRRGFDSLDVLQPDIDIMSVAIIMFNKIFISIPFCEVKMLALRNCQ